jgi:hypothetical protein
MSHTDHISELLTVYSKNIQPMTSNQVRVEKMGNKWMEPLFGFSDSILNEFPTYDNKRDIVNELLTKSVSYNETNGKLRTIKGDWDAGIFIAPSLKDIKELVIKYGIKGTPRVTVVQGKDAADLHIECDPYECIQAASQLNALEMVHPDRVPLDGIEIYKDDMTQGPIVAMSCALGTFVRNYIVPKKLFGQFNALENIKLFPTNGYLLWENDPQTVLNKLIGRTDDIMIPCMLYCQVAGAKVRSREIRIMNKHVHQIYNSSVPVDSYGNGGNFETQKDIAKIFSYAGYMGAIGMAIILHHFDKLTGKSNLPRPKINLTLIGGGVFNVPLDLILDSINQAINEFRDYNIDIIVQAYGVNEAAQARNKLNIIKEPIRPNGEPMISLDTVQPGNIQLVILQLKPEGLIGYDANTIHDPPLIYQASMSSPKEIIYLISHFRNTTTIIEARKVGEYVNFQYQDTGEDFWIVPRNHPNYNFEFSLEGNLVPLYLTGDIIRIWPPIIKGYDHKNDGIDVSKYLIVYNLPEGALAYPLRLHQTLILKTLLVSQENEFEFIMEREQPDEVIVFASKDNNGMNLNFKNIRGERVWFININDPRIKGFGSIDGIPKGAYVIVTKEGTRLHEWPILL